ncbi:solute carrier family 12 member 7 [Trichinella spiralis]|uniref:solute carrier family 12 member 7 n=1 Tax=Trichinella spiralis TaxID=6334 RepID=UPI0001EFEC76|nr:solute carrier family 12 member 7 [Trichinella spiralis]
MDKKETDEEITTVKMSTIEESPSKKASDASMRISQKALALYEEDGPANINSVSMYLKSLSGVATDETGPKRAKLGTIFGVYLPSIQHILGVQMFLRLIWMVGVGGLIESFSMI